MFQRKRGREALFRAEKGVRTGHLVHMFGKPKMARMRLLHAKGLRRSGYVPLAKAETRLSVRRVFSDRECFDKEKWWRKTTCHRNNGASDEVADRDARAFGTRKTTWHRNNGDADEVCDFEARAFRTRDCSCHRNLTVLDCAEVDAAGGEVVSRSPGVSHCHDASTRCLRARSARGHRIAPPRHARVLSNYSMPESPRPQNCGCPHCG